MRSPYQDAERLAFVGGQFDGETALEPVLALLPPRADGYSFGCCHSALLIAVWPAAPDVARRGAHSSSIWPGALRLLFGISITSADGSAAARASPARMCLAMRAGRSRHHLRHRIELQVGVSLRRGRVHMAEGLAHEVEASAACNGGAGKAVAQSMDRHVLQVGFRQRSLKNFWSPRSARRRGWPGTPRACLRSAAALPGLRQPHSTGHYARTGFRIREMKPTGLQIDLRPLQPADLRLPDSR